MARRRYQQGSLLLRGKRTPAWFGRWREDVIVEGRVKRIRKTEFLGYRKDFPTRKLAMRELELRLAEINRPDRRPLRSETFSQFCDWWTKNVLPQFKPSTQEGYGSQVRNHLLPFFGKYLMKDIQWQIIQSFIQEAQACARTRKNMVYTLKAMWNSARAGGWVNHDPFEDLKTPTADDPAEFFYTPEEAKLIIANAEGQFKTMYWIAAETGIRAGELLGLCLSNIQLDNCMIRITQSVWRGIIQQPKTKRAKRPIAITAELAEHIRSYLSTWKPNEKNLLFAKPSGKPWTPGFVRRYYLKPLCDKLDIQTAGLKAFRHCSATMMDRAGVPLKVRQERLGHHPGSAVTMVHYTHAIPEDNRAAAVAIGGMLN